jgi:hypothetical protein
MCKKEFHGTPKYKDIVELIKTGATLEAQEKVMELQEENMDLKERLSKVLAQLKNKESVSFKNGMYWQLDGEEPDTPYCPKCHDTNDKLVRMHRDGKGWWCYQCKDGFGTARHTTATFSE